MKQMVKRLVDRVPAIGKLARHYRDTRAEQDLRWGKIPGTTIEVLGGNWLAAGGDHEGDELNLFREMLDQADTVVDVGANSGVFSCVAAGLGKAVHAFEPMPQNLRILARTIDHNGFGDKVQVYPLAVSSAVGIARFFGKGQGASLIEGWAGQPSYDAILVPTNTLDNLLAQRLAGSRVLLKIDVEGAELEVLKGAAQLLGNCTGVMLENGISRNVPGGKNAAFAAIFEFLDQQGFTCRVADAEGREVTPELARQWAEAGATPFDTLNYAFRRAVN